MAAGYGLTRVRLVRAELKVIGALQNADITQGDALSCELTAPLGRNMENELRNLFFYTLFKIFLLCFKKYEK